MVWLYALGIITLVILIVCVLWLALFERNKPSASSLTASSLTTSSKTLSSTSEPKATYFRFMDDLSNKNSIELFETMKQVLDTDGIGMGERTSAAIYFFESLDIIDYLMTKAPFGPNTKYVFGIQGTDDIVSKSMMALRMREKLSVDTIVHILPITFIYDIPNDIKLLFNDIRMESGVYILKKNIQRQEGNLITRDPNTIMGAGKQKYVVAQRLLSNPMIIGGRKINMRVYLLISIPPGGQTARFYIYKNGFIYYTPKLWDPDSIDPDVHITTGYIDRQVYAQNPLTFRDLEVHMGSETYGHLWNNIMGVMSHVRETYQDRLTENNKMYPGTKFLIYGCDIAPDNRLDVKLIEINKGPDLGYKDERDKQVKFNMVSDAFRLVGMTGTTTMGDFAEV